MRIAVPLMLVLLICAIAPASASSAAQEELCKAAKTGSPDDVAAAIGKGARVNDICDSIIESALDAAIAVARVDNVEALIKAGAKVESRRRMPLGNVRNAATAEVLLNHGADANAVDDYGKTPLMHLSTSAAMNFGDLKNMTDQDAAEIAQLLIARGARVNVADKYGETALIDASFSCLPNLVSVLITSGADVNARNSFDQTGLQKVENIKDMNPADCGQTEQVLLAHGAVR